MCTEYDDEAIMERLKDHISSNLDPGTTVSLQWFRTGNYREDDHYGLAIPAMDIPSTNDSRNWNNTQGEPEEYLLTFGEVIVIRPADQLHQEEAETVGNRVLDLQCD
ncbi:hypothetical protein E4U61_006680 [Claviceps capensis]|nr:hypothetical protein E4U61_006680 [Claviceps capensis]